MSGSISGSLSGSVSGTVSGAVLDEDGVPLGMVVVAFAPAAGGAEVTAMSDDDGTYSVELDDGTWTATCTNLGGDCTLSDGRTSTEITVPGDVELDFVARQWEAPTTTPRTDDGGGGSAEEQCRAGGYTVCGFVTQDGHPVAGMIIEAKFGSQNQTVTTNDEGGYGLTLQIPVATLLCEETEVMLDENLICQADGSGGLPVSIDSGTSGQIVNFTVVPS
ncbi:hypothetical protein GON03_03345 [Nocardioides sp. MAH-18]|uniref:Carboxypeptidase regulatory-like domain-containing protein n=1 Tax=Nocardioides agri TaxID=2682843 RepID=A0A6L6XN99_9ACTN|nr:MULTISPECIES: carboxypeptidase-like regulatory domain-containing protein [unclassified Nocardioides]MBA2953335.1 carboxypeptidase regulatory-like domain-containing protein [Nocardioides sp. CGMCC 1.13656]MVQ48203.1 hypothetical protein [Nocardioides sp. MAH-18]